VKQVDKIRFSVVAVLIAKFENFSGKMPASVCKRQLRKLKVLTATFYIISHNYVKSRILSFIQS
jgi:hypothetical protein